MATPDDLQDARVLFTFAREHANCGDDKHIISMAVRAAIDAAGEDYAVIAAACGWTAKDLTGFSRRAKSGQLPEEHR
jgi:hypothetical protein